MSILDWLRNARPADGGGTCWKIAIARSTTTNAIVLFKGLKR